MLGDPTVNSRFSRAFRYHSIRIKQLSPRVYRILSGERELISRTTEKYQCVRKWVTRLGTLFLHVMHELTKRPQSHLALPGLRVVANRLADGVHHVGVANESASMVPQELTCKGVAGSVQGRPQTPPAVFLRKPALSRSNQPVQKRAISAAVSRLMSGQQVGKISVPWIVPITCRQRARTPLCRSNR